MDNTLRGSGLPPTWKMQGVDSGIRISSSDLDGEDGWILPRGEMRFLSPLMRQLLNIKEVSYNSPRRLRFSGR